MKYKLVFVLLRFDELELDEVAFDDSSSSNVVSFDDSSNSNVVSFDDEAVVWPPMPENQSNNFLRKSNEKNAKNITKRGNVQKSSK